jgi:hypothetical protein
VLLKSACRPSAFVPHVLKLEAAKEEARKGREALEAERQAHEQTRSNARETLAVAGERAKCLAALDEVGTGSGRIGVRRKRR